MTECNRCGHYLGEKTAQNCKCEEHSVYVTTSRPTAFPVYDRSNFEIVWVSGIDMQHKAEKLAQAYYEEDPPSDGECVHYVHIDDEVYKVRTKYG